jgi:putative ABC transport system permease protein
MNGESIKYSLRNLNHRKGRSFLTIFSIMVGIATIFIFISFGYGLYDYTESFTTSSSVDKVMIMAKGTGAPGMDETFVIDDDDLRVIERAAGVYEASGVYYDVVSVESKNENKFVFLVSYDPKVPLVMDIFQVGVENGRILRSGDKGVVLGYNYLLDNKIFEKGLEINDVIKINDESFKILGFLESIGNPSDDSQIYVTNDLFLDIFPDKETYAEIVARVDVDNLDVAINNIERGLRKHRDLEEGKEDFFVQSFEDMIESFSGAINVIIGFVILIALISVLVSAINTANTMITSVLERYKEIGILKAIGARNSEIFNIFLFESAFLGVVAGGLGVLVGLGITSLAGNILESLGWGFLAPYYSFWLFMGLILFAGITGAISGVIPAIRASKTNVVDALRYE